MSSREPLWFCHECGAEAQPLMAPDPVCASCHSSFVEMMDNTNDDPRNFSQADPADDGFNDAYMSLVARLLESTSRPNSRTRDSRDNEPLPRPRVAMSFGGATGTRVFSSAGSTSAETPTFSEYIRRGPDIDQPGGISGALLGQYMMSMLGMAPGGSGGLNEMFARGFGADSGRMGDYVFNQEALDEVITQLMENNNSHRPVPATEEIMEKLPREVLEVGSPMLQKDCAVCKDQFSLDSEDPGEQIVVSLPCKHPFHESCILPWLNSSGTCPVCRHQLIPQPEHHAPGSGDAGGPGRPGSSPRRAPTLLQSLFGGRVPDASSSGTQGSSSSRANPNQSSRHSNDHHHVPGGWDGLD